MESFAMEMPALFPQPTGLACWNAGFGSKGDRGRVKKENRSIFLSLPVEHFVPSCSSIGNQDKPGTTVRRENTRSHSDLDMWNRLAPYVLKLFGRHGKSPVKK
jgi:hypothetical protein